MTLMGRYDNLIIIRTFSKGFGLANLRAGYLVLPRKLTAMLRQCSNPYVLSDIQRRACAAALTDPDFPTSHADDFSSAKRQIAETIGTRIRMLKTDARVPICTLTLQEDGNLQQLLIDAGVLALIVLGVINATASSMIADLTGWTGWVGVIILSLGIIYLILRGTETIEKVLSFWSYILYAVYAVFMIMCFVKFGPQISEAFAAGAGFIKAVDDRIEITSARNGEATPTWVRPVIAIGLTLIGVAVSTFGLTGLIAKGYGTVCWGFLIVYFIPMLTIGIYKISKAGK